MFGIGQFEFEWLVPIVALVVWFRVFRHGRRFSLLSLFVLITGVALWLALFRPWEPRGLF
jgi:hypothetical protein